MGMRFAGSEAFVDGLQTHPSHQPPDAVPPDDRAFSSQIGRDPGRSEERVSGKHPVDLFHHRQRVRIDTDRRVVEGRPAQPHKPALLAYA